MARDETPRRAPFALVHSCLDQAEESSLPEQVPEPACDEEHDQDGHEGVGAEKHGAATVLSLEMGCVSEGSTHKYIEYWSAGDNVAADQIFKAYCTSFRVGDPIIVLGDDGRRMRVKRPGELVEYFRYGFAKGGDRWHDGKPWPKATTPPKR